MDDNLFYLLKSFLKKENIKFNDDELKLQILSHPSYPSLHSVTGVLDHFGITNMALEVPQTEDIFNQLPKNFIALVDYNELQDFTLVSKTEATKVNVLFGNKKNEKLSLSEFLKAWKGVIVVVEKDEINEQKETSNKTSIAYPLLFTTALLLLGLIFINNKNYFQFINLIISGIGVYISSLIIKQELGYSSSTLNKVCNNTKTTSCNDVLKSNGAQIFKNLKLSDLSVIYFSGLSLYIITNLTGFTTSSSIIWMVTALSLPITFFSIYYQYKVVKKWCMLCLGIVGTLWLQLIFNSITTTNYFSFSQINIYNILTLAISLTLAASLWLFFKPLLEKEKELLAIKTDFVKFKRNFNLFNTLLKKERIINTHIPEIKEIVFGNIKAPIKVVLITNPSCFFCKEAHTDIEQLLKTSSNSLSITIRFNVPNSKENIANRVAARLLEMNKTEKKDNFLIALHEAYEKNSNLENWIKKWQEAKDKSFTDVLNIQKQWCQENAINFTPAFLIDGKNYPKEYNRTDLQYFIEDLVEEKEADTAHLLEEQTV